MKRCGKLPLMKTRGSDHIVVYVYIYIYLFIQFIHLLFTGPKCRSNSPGAELVTGSGTFRLHELVNLPQDTSKFENGQVKVATWWRLVLSFDNIIEDCLEVPKNTVKIL